MLRLPATDPLGADLVVSCGAALHHLRVGPAALGWQGRRHPGSRSRAPQLVIRVGWAAFNADPLPATPRRPVIRLLRGQGQN